MHALARVSDELVKYASSEKKTTTLAQTEVSWTRIFMEISFVKPQNDT